MIRLVGSLLLLALVLPYARAPMCQADAHEHDHGHGGAHAALDVAGHGSAPAGDCHALMGCGTLLVASSSVIESLHRAAPRQPEVRPTIVHGPRAPVLSPESPPPRSV